MQRIPKSLRVLIPTVLIAVWMTVGALGGPYFGRIEEVSDVDLAAFLPKSAEATQVNEELKRFRDSTTLPAIVVFEGKNGKELSSSQVEQINGLGKKNTQREAVEGEVSPAIVSDDGKAAFYIVQISDKANPPDVVADLRKDANEAKIAGADFRITGPAGFSADLNKAFAGIDGILLITALAVVFVILIVVYRSILLPIIVLMTSMLALCASILLVWWLAKQDIIQLNGQVQGILFILVIGAATDYSLLYVSRYREELYAEQSKFLATLKAWKGAFEPILASGGTVIAGLLCLLLSDLASNKALGPVGSIGIAFAVLSALTFLPAVLYIFGRASFWPARPLADDESRKRHSARLQTGFWHRIGDLVGRRPRAVWVTTAILLLAASFFVSQLKAEGVPQSDLIVGYSEARSGQQMLNRHFPDGSGSPAYVITPAGSLDLTVKAIDSVSGIDGVNVVATGVEAGFKPLGKSEEKIKSEIRKEVQKQFGEAADVPGLDSIVDNAYPFKNAQVRVENGEVLLQATFADAPDSDAAKDTLVRLRSTVKNVNRSAKVGGSTAVQYDTNQTSIRDRLIIIPIVLGVITLILMALLRSVIAPLLLLATTVISFAASLGIAAILFNDIWQLPGADPSVLLYAFVFLVALGIDYNIFLMTRVREETAKSGTREGVIKGLVVTGGVITSAGVVLAATFAALGVIPILFLAQLAFIVAFGVLLDTFVVRSLLVPALIRDIGPFVWWPSKLKQRP